MLKRTQNPNWLLQILVNYAHEHNQFIVFEIKPIKKTVTKTSKNYSVIIHRKTH